MMCPLLLLLALTAGGVMSGHYGYGGGGYRQQNNHPGDRGGGGDRWGGGGGGGGGGGYQHGGGRGGYKQGGGGYQLGGGGGNHQGGGSRHGGGGFGFFDRIGAGSYTSRDWRYGGLSVGAVVDPCGRCQTQADDRGDSSGGVEKCPAIADILFLLDTSSSMSKSDFELEKEFAISLTEHFNVGPNDVRFGAVTFSDRVQQSFSLGAHSSNEAVKTAIRNTAFLAGGTKTYQALDYIRVNRLFGSRVKCSRIVVVLTDGLSDNRAATSKAATALKETGVKMISVGIGDLTEELSDMTSDPSLVFVADDFNSLSRIKQRVASGICTVPETEGYIPPTDTGSKSCPEGFQPNPDNPSTCIDINECQTDNPCQQKCINLPGSVRCTCNSGSVIDQTDTTKCKALLQCSDLLDIVFLIDESGSIGTKNYELQLKFVAKLTEHFLFGVKGARFGAVLFATTVRKLFDLDTYASRKDVTSRLLGAEYSQGGTNTHLGISYVLDNDMFSKSCGGRDNADKVLIVLTDGESSRADETKSAAARAKATGARVMAVGVGDQVNTGELINMASSSKDVFVVSEFDLLDYIEERLTNRICQSAGS
ncbi:hypothetical protein BsWGS_25848 [Bradybaena similaris]